MNNSVAIIGGGISGLYIANKLLEQRYHVTIFEKSNRLGGRVHTVQLKGLGNIETGAGRFNEKHKLLLKLIRDCGAESNVGKIPFQKRWYYNGTSINHRNYSDNIEKRLFANITKWLNKYSKHELFNMTMRDLLLLEFPSNTVVDIVSAFGYNSEFEIQNAYTTLHILSKEFNDNIQYYYLNGGLSQLTSSLEAMIKEKGGTLQLNTTVIGYEPTKNIVSFAVKGRSVEQQSFQKVVFACTKKALLAFSDLLNYDQMLMNYIRTIEMAPLNRMFALFPVQSNGLAWFDGVRRTTTNLPIRYIIPFDPKKGLIQISYTDNEFARYWRSKSNQECKTEITKQLRLMFPDKDIPEPLWIKSFYWNEGVTYWKPSYKSYRNSKNKPYYIAGEIMSSTHSGWIEGALQSAHNVIGMFTTR
jgi:hypothetical protein